MQDLEQKRKRIESLVKVGGLGVAGFFVAPFIFIAIKGIIGLAIAATVGWGMIFATPVVGRTLANWRLKALKAEAMRNPIETLQNDYGKRQLSLKNFAERIGDFSAAVGSFQDKLSQFKKQRPEDSDKFDDQLGKMKQLLSIRKVKLQDAKRELDQYDQEIQRAKDIWEMGQAAAAMTSAAGMSEDDFLQKISTETALDSVQASMNRAFGDLEVSLIEEQKPAAQIAPSKTKAATA